MDYESTDYKEQLNIIDDKVVTLTKEQKAKWLYNVISTVDDSDDFIREMLSGYATEFDNPIEMLEFLEE